MVPDRFYFRRFLNRPGHHGGAYLLASVEDTSRRDDDGESGAWIEFELADCSRRVRLEFPLGTRRDRLNSTRKAHLLLTAVEAFVAAVDEEARLSDERADKRQR